MAFDFQLTQPAICLTVRNLVSNIIFGFLLAIFILLGLISSLLLNLIIGRKFDRLLKPLIYLHPSLEEFFKYPGIPFYNLGYRTQIYIINIFYNPVGRLKKLEQKQVLNDKEKRLYKYWRGLADRFYGLDFRANTNKLDIALIVIFLLICTILLLLGLLMYLAHDYCGINDP